MKKEVVKVKPRSSFDIVDSFRQLESHNRFLFAVFIGIGLVAFWRGLTLLMDVLVFPENKLLSGLFSTLLGLTLLTATGALLRFFG